MANRYIIGLDIGGTNIRAICLPERPTLSAVRFAVRHAVRLSTPHTKQEFFRALESIIKKLAPQSTRGNSLLGIGAALAGVVDPSGARLVGAANIPFLRGWEAKKYFRRLAPRAAIENDVRCFLRAEHRFGAARGYAHATAMAVGTGIGGAIMIDGKLWGGALNSAGEIGHSVFCVKGPASAKASAGRQGSRVMYQEFEKMAAKEAYEKYGDRSNLIGVGVANFINIVGPEIMVLGGGGGLSKHVNLKIVRSAARKHALRSIRGKTLIVKGTLGDTAQAIGAALLVASPK